MLGQQKQVKAAQLAKSMILLVILSTSLAQPYKENHKPSDFSVILSQNSSSAGFPQLLWTFWDGNLQNPNTQIFLKLCLHNMNEYATKSGWQFNLVTYNNLEKYLSKQNYERCMRLLGRVESSFKQVRADIIRLLLLKQNGGMWVDSSTFFVEKLDWINNIATQPIPILNRLSSNPQLLTFRMQDYDKPNPWIFDEDLQQSINVSPGIENWGIIAKPNTAFINDSLDIIQEISMKGQSYIQNKIAENSVQLSTYANNSYFKFGIYTFQIVLQIKQKQLNQRWDEDTALNQALPKYAVDYYKIWTLSGETIGFGLEKITDGITPFLSFIFLSSDAQLIDAYKIKLRGFVKLGGIKRKYMQMILQKLTNTEMCSILLDDAFKVTNQSYLYKHLIADNEQHTGLVLKDHINNIYLYKADKIASCKVSAGQTQMFLSVSKNIKYTFVWICIFVGILLVLALYYIKVYNFLKITHKIIFLTGLALALVLLVFSITFTSSSTFREEGFSSLTKSKEAGISYSFQTSQMTENISILSQNGICSAVFVQSDVQKLLLTQQYHHALKQQLPDDNGTFLQMLFNQKILKHQDDFSQFVGLNKWAFIGYFRDYFFGILLFVIAIAAHKRRSALLSERISRSKIINFAINTLRLMIFVFLLFLSFGAFLKSISLKSSVQTSICYFAKIPSYLENGDDSMSKAVTEGEFINALASQFEDISFTMIALKSALTSQTEQYQKELITIKEQAAQSNDQELFQLLQNKEELLVNLQSDVLNVVDSLVCENRIILGFKLAYDNIRNLLQKLVYFFDHFLSIKTLSYLASAVLITIAFIFCLFSSIFLIKSLKKKNLTNSSQRRSLLILGIVGLVLSFTLNCFVLSNYYLCDFLAQYKNSLEKSSDFFMNILPKPCMSNTLSDLFVQDIQQNLQRRHQPFREFLSLSEQMGQIGSYPFDKEKQLLLASNNNNQVIDHFVGSSEEYNQMLQRISTSYAESKAKVETALDKQYISIPNVNFVGKLETVLFQPLCTFNFNVLYEITSYFTYLGLFNLLAFFVSLIHDRKPSSKDQQIDLLADQSHQISQKQMEKQKNTPDLIDISQKENQLQEL